MIDPLMMSSQPQPITITYMHPDKWEYKAIYVGIDTDDLNELGQDGWELVSVTTETEEFSSVAYLKRPVYLKAMVSNG